MVNNKIAYDALPVSHKCEFYVWDPYVEPIFMWEDGVIDHIWCNE